MLKAFFSRNQRLGRSLNGLVFLHFPIRWTERHFSHVSSNIHTLLLPPHGRASNDTLAMRLAFCHAYRPRFVLRYLELRHSLLNTRHDRSPNGE